MPAHPFRAGMPLPVRCFLLVSLCFALAGVSCSLRAQSPGNAASAVASPAGTAAPSSVFDASNLQAPRPLYALWAVKAGDNPAWSSPAYDDSQWLRLAPDAVPLSNYIHGRPTVLWYRLHVKVAPGQSGLALEVWNLDSAFDVYVNGRLFLRNGSVVPFLPRTLDAHIIRSIPAADIASGSLLIALRVHISPGDWNNVDPALFISNSKNDASENLSIGQLTALRDHAWLTVLGQNALTWINIWGGLGLGIVALALFLSQRSQREYLWIFLFFLSQALQWPVSFLRLFHTLNPAWVAAQAPVSTAGTVSLVLMYFAFLRQPLSQWLRILLAVGAIVLAVAVGSFAYQQVPPVGVVLGEFPILFLLCGIIPFRLILQWHRGSREAGILLIPVLLYSISADLQVLFYFLNLIPSFRVFSYRATLFLFASHLGPFQITLNDVAQSLFVLSLAILMVLRATRTSRQQALLEAELAAAREVQQVILPDQIESVPGFTVETVYQPARQVGGDFFQVLPDGKGGLLIVVGDVAGKGLPAAMLVSVLVGAIRTAASYTTDPAGVLAQLNDRLVGRGSGSFSTALAARIAPDGVVTLANAGHLPPYLDGREVSISGSLPLGVQLSSRFESTSFHLKPGNRLTFVSDGVVEAQNPRGELFGFDRTAQISTQPAEAIAHAAQQFGQEDDITVLTLAYAPLEVAHV